MKANKLTNWLQELELLIERYATPDIRADYPSMTLDDKRALYFRLIRHEQE